MQVIVVWPVETSSVTPVRPHGVAISFSPTSVFASHTRNSFLHNCVVIILYHGLTSRGIKIHVFMFLPIVTNSNIDCIIIYVIILNSKYRCNKYVCCHRCRWWSLDPCFYLLLNFGREKKNRMVWNDHPPRECISCLAYNARCCP